MKTEKLAIAMTVQSILWIGAMEAALLVPAGTWRWPQAWAFAAIYGFGGLIYGFWLIRRDPALLASRLEVVQKGQKTWDRVFILVFLALWYAWLVLMALDTMRWRPASHLAPMPMWVNVLGGLMMCAGFAATTRVFRANSFAAPVVRVQEERHQRVIDSGPYAIVRHPMYAFAPLYLFGMPLLLGSAWGLLVAPVIVLGMAIRSIFEERMLARELPGYADYMKRVRWRLIPGIW